MTLSEQLKAVIQILKKKNTEFSLAGGLVASLYRSEERLTKDIDVLFLAKNQHEKIASQILQELGLTPVAITQAEMEGGPLHAIKNKSTPIWMVCGTSTDNSKFRVDFLLPSIPWFSRALERSKANLVDFGFGKIPCLTREDLILSKLFALTNRSDRFKDLDDLQSIFESKAALDLSYLSDRMGELKLKIPEPLRKRVPKILLRAAKS
jgi:hypothetical protein